MQSQDKRVVILGTGGTIAGRAASATDNVGYSAGQISVAALIAAVPPLAGQLIEAEQVAQVDSKDMDAVVWQHLVARAAHHLARDDVAAVVVTHGTDTLEETAWLLHRVLAPNKPLVLTAAMRPASSLQADGPQNLLDALAVARSAGVAGVVVVMAGRVWAAQGLRKADVYRLDAFSGDELARVEEGAVRILRPWPLPEAPLGAAVLELPSALWPRVAWLTSHAGFDAALVDAAVAGGYAGLLVAGTGNGSLHHALEAALLRAQAAGVTVRRSTRCASAVLVGALPSDIAASTAVGPAQGRIELLLELLQRRRVATPASSMAESASTSECGSGTEANPSMRAV